jgi:nicotinamide riboside kinase
MPERKSACVIAILGAESTGKTTLSQDLAQALHQQWALRAIWVPEWLRTWCAHEGRTPAQDEQEAIARQQTALIDAATSDHEVVVCDTTAIMTAVYSQLLFGDRSLEPLALKAHQSIHLTLVTDLDIAWQADGLQRDGPHVREPVDRTLCDLLTRHQIPWSRVTGSGPQRLSCALAHVQAALERHRLS